MFIVVGAGVRSWGFNHVEQVETGRGFLKGRSGVFWVFNHVEQVETGRGVLGFNHVEQVETGRDFFNGEERQSLFLGVTRHSLMPGRQLFSGGMARRHRDAPTMRRTSRVAVRFSSSAAPRRPKRHNAIRKSFPTRRFLVTK